MKIKYLKPAPLGNVGDVAVVPNDEAKVLIAIGYAEEHKQTKARQSKDKNKTNQKTSTDNE